MKLSSIALFLFLALLSSAEATFAQTDKKPDAPAVIDLTGESIGWSTVANRFSEKVGARLKLSCPGSGELQHTIWGTDIYTEDSSICVAAVHAGIITTSGGAVIIEISSGRRSYAGTKRNGVVSEEYGSWPKSFVFVVEEKTEPK